MADQETLSRIQQVGFIGLGDQGAPMARAIAEAGFSLQVWARRPASLETLVGVPHVVHASPAALAGACELLSLTLNDDQDVWAVLNGHDVLKSLKPGTAVVNHGTGDPNENRRLASMLEKAGVMYLDAPVSGGRSSAVARTLTTIVGGDKATYVRCLPVFESFSAKTAYMGASGNGQMTKLLNNALTMTNLKNVVDVFSLAQRLDLEISDFYDVVSASSGSSRILEALPQLSEAIASHLQRLMRKDIEHFADGVRANDQEPGELLSRGLAGALGLVDVVRLLAQSRKTSVP